MIEQSKLYVLMVIIFPIDGKNEIKDKPLSNYLSERIQTYSNRLKDESIWIENLTNELLEKY